MPVDLTDPGIHRVLVPLDLEEHSEVVFAHALKLALATGATLTTVHVRQDPAAIVDWTTAPSALALLQQWGVLGPTATEADVAALQLHIEQAVRLHKSPELGIVQVVIERLPNIIVMGTHGRRGLDRLRHGSVSESVARRSGAVSLFVPRGCAGFVEDGTGRARIRRVLFPVGGDAAELQRAVDVLEAMLEVLGVRACTITCTHVGPDPLPQLTLPARPGWDFEAVRTEHPDVVAGILGALRGTDPDLVVMGTRGHDSFADLVAGSRTERIVRQSTCPVLVVPIAD